MINGIISFGVLLLVAMLAIIPVETTKSAAALSQVCAKHQKTSSISFQQNGRAIVVCKDGTVKWAPR